MNITLKRLVCSVFSAASLAFPLAATPAQAHWRIDSLDTGIISVCINNQPHERVIDYRGRTVVIRWNGKGDPRDRYVHVGNNCHRRTTRMSPSAWKALYRVWLRY